jgi:hypothetical protein
MDRTIFVKKWIFFYLVPLFTNSVRSLRFEHIYTLLNKESGTHTPIYFDDKKFDHPHRSIVKIRHQHRSGRSIYRIWMTKFSVTHIVEACVPVGFRNSVIQYTTGTHSLRCPTLFLFNYMIYTVLSNFYSVPVLYRYIVYWYCN